MSNTTLVISDLHLADGHTILDGFGDAQQAAFEALRHARPLTPLDRWGMLTKSSL